MATEQQVARIVLGYYENKYIQKYNRKPRMNRYKSRWGIIDLVDEFGQVRAQELIDFYFKTTSGNDHSIQWFLYNYEKLAKSLEEQKSNEETIKRLKEESRLRTLEWNEKHGN